MSYNWKYCYACDAVYRAEIKKLARHWDGTITGYKGIDPIYKFGKPIPNIMAKFINNPRFIFMTFDETKEFYNILVNEFSYRKELELYESGNRDNVYQIIEETRLRISHREALGFIY